MKNIYICTVFFLLLFRSHHHSSNSLRQYKRRKKITTKNKFFFIQSYISALIRSDVEIVDGRIFTFGVTKSPSFALPDGECDDGGTTAAVG
jgi:hypothetical protein